MDETTAALEWATTVLGLLVVLVRLTTETAQWWATRHRGAVDDPTPGPAGVRDAGRRRSGVERAGVREDDGA